MGLYTINIRNELDAIRKIRNSFAHSAKSLTFETKQIKDECCSFDKSMMIDSDGTTRGNYIDVCGKIVLILFAIIAMQHTKKFLRNDFGDNETTKATANRVADGLENLFRFINNLEK